MTAPTETMYADVYCTICLLSLATAWKESTERVDKMKNSPSENDGAAHNRS